MGLSSQGHSRASLYSCWRKKSWSHPQYMLSPLVVSDSLKSVDWSPPGSSVPGIFPARTLEWIALPSSRGSSWPSDWTYISFGSGVAGRFFTAESQGKSSHPILQSPSCFWLFVIPRTAACQASLSLIISWNLPKFMSIELVMPSSYLILWCPLLLLPSIFPSIRVFSNESSGLHQITKIREFSISPSKEYSGWSLLRLTGLILLCKGLSRLLQHLSLKASILWRSAFFMVQLSQPYVTTGKTVALTIWTFIGKVMSLLSNTLSRLVIAFLPRSNRLLISWLQSPSAVILKPRKRKSVTTSTFPMQ